MKSYYVNEESFLILKFYEKYKNEIKGKTIDQFLDYFENKYSFLLSIITIRHKVSIDYIYNSLQLDFPDIDVKENESCHYDYKIEI